MFELRASGEGGGTGGHSCDPSTRQGQGQSGQRRFLIIYYLLTGRGKNARINNIHALLAGTITYSFVTAPGEKLKFEINNRTGLIRTTQVLDRDEPAREKEAYLTVLATDNGRPQLDDVCTFKVTIEDVNDNSPVFDKVVRAYLV